MKVKAIAMGFHDGKRQRVNSEFEVPDGKKGKWFVPVDKAKPKGKTKEDKGPETLSELARVEHKDQGDTALV